MTRKEKPVDDLAAVLKNSTQACAFFGSLPEYVQDMIFDRFDSIHSEDDLYRYADNLTAGDK